MCASLTVKADFLRAADIRQIYQSWELPAENEENGATFRKSVQSGGWASMTMECSRLGMMSAGLERLSGLAARPRVQNVEFGTFRSNSNSLFLFFLLRTRFNAMFRHNWHFNHICQQKMFVRNTPCLAIKPPLAMVNGRPFVRVNV